jgi:hypothetical protein
MPVDDHTRQRIINTLTDYSKQAKAIRDDDNLSPVGVQRALAKLYTDTNTRVAAMRDQAEQGYTSRRRALEAELFGAHGTNNPAAAMSMRDALSRAGDMKSAADADKLMRQAIMSGDEYLARAVASHAFTQRDGVDKQHWERILTGYQESQDSRRQDLLGELSMLANLDTKSVRVEESIAYGVARPAELGHGNIDYLLDAPVEAAGAA